MNFENYLIKKLLKKHDPTEKEIRDLFKIAKRDLNNDWQFGILYNAILKYCAILLRATGHRTTSIAHP